MSTVQGIKYNRYVTPQPSIPLPVEATPSQPAVPPVPTSESDTEEGSPVKPGTVVPESTPSGTAATAGRGGDNAMGDNTRMPFEADGKTTNANSRTSLPLFALFVLTVIWTV